ncbi:YqzH family protein [Bacillus mycoides]|uniref:YqzH family protein n=1 Tax=Bacillus mycoides TaxID=1405 RepID=UPI002A7613EB|nr:YqzH family protein [Bacillus mycoides]
MQAGKNTNKKLIEKMIIKSFRQYQCNPVSKEDQEMLIKHIQMIIHSNTEIDVYEAVEDIVYDYVTGK